MALLFTAFPTYTFTTLISGASLKNWKYSSVTQLFQIYFPINHPAKPCLNFLISKRTPGFWIDPKEETEIIAKKNDQLLTYVSVDKKSQQLEFQNFIEYRSRHLLHNKSDCLLK